jgi:tRNA-Thr(GGU) m(6)t(6)A37 methyltransferase TsaA
MVLHPIGLVRSEIRDRKAMPPMGAPARIELLPNYADGLLHLEKHSHIWVLAWLDQARRDLLQVTPRGVREQGAEGLHGVFAVRSPARPNPIGLTVARIVRMADLSIEVDMLDFLDGTPVVDLKPYFAARDIIFSASNAQIGRPVTREAMRESLVRQAVNFHGELCVDLALAVRATEHFRYHILEMGEPAVWKVTVPLQRRCMIDAVMGMTRVTPGRGNLVFGPTDHVRFEHNERICTYEFLACGISAPEAVLCARNGELFRFTTG